MAFKVLLKLQFRVVALLLMKAKERVLVKIAERRTMSMSGGVFIRS